MNKKTFVLGIVFSICAALLLFLNVWQSFRYNEVVKTVIGLEKKQRELLEVNKRLIAGTAVLSSPGRIDEIAKDDLGLMKATPSDMIQIELPFEEQ